MKSRFIVAVGTLIAVFVAGPVYAAKCSNSAKGFERFKKDFARDARAAGIGRAWAIGPGIGSIFNEGHQI